VAFVSPVSADGDARLVSARTGYHPPTLAQT
jgi:hypothetical protein